jgi:hypothetical protein
MTDTIIPNPAPPAVAIAILHFIESAARFAMELRATTENTGQPISVPSEAMTGFLMMLDFIHSKPKGIVVNEQAQLLGIKPIVFDIRLVELLVEYIASEAGQNNTCDCPVCTAHRAAQAIDEASAVAVKH